MTNHSSKILIAGLLTCLTAIICAAQETPDAPTTPAVSTPAPATKPVVKNDPKLDRALIEALRENEESKALEALEKGANPNARGKDDITPLMLAAQNGKVALTKKLLASGAEANAVNKNQQTALHLSMEFGAPKPKKKRFGGLGGILGGTAANVAVSGGLGSFGSSGVWAGNLLGSSGLDYLLGANLRNFVHGGVFNLTGRSGWNAVIGTALQGDLTANGVYGMQNLLGSAGRLDASGWINLASAVNSADAQVLDVMRNVPGGDPRWSQFMSAAANGNRSAVEAHLADPSMRQLFEQAEQGFAESRSELPGNAAKSIVTALLEHGANAEARDKQGKTPTELAKARDWNEIVTLLKSGVSTPANETTAAAETKE